MIRILLITLIFLVYFSDTRAQLDSTTLAEKEIFQLPRSAVKWYSLYLINRFPTIQLGYEFNISKKVNLEFNVGYVMELVQDEFERDFQNRRGIKSGLQIRQYLSTQRMNTFFISAGLDYFYIKYDRARTFGFGCDNEFGCDYFRFDQYQVIRQDRRMNVRAGILTALGRNFYLEMAAGVTLISRKFRTNDRVTGFDIQYGDTSLKENEEELFLLPLAAINLVYKLK